MVLYMEAKSSADVYGKVKGIARMYGLGRSPKIIKMKYPPLNAHEKRMPKAKKGKNWYSVVF